MPEDEKSNEEKEEGKSSIIDTEDGGVAVSIEEETTPEKAVEKKEEEKKPERKQDPITNKVYAHDRILANVQKSIEELKEMMLINSPSSAISQKQEVELGEIDKLAEKDWKAAVGKIAEARTREILATEQTKIEQTKSIQEEAQIMERNSQSVLGRHPELEDVSSEKSQVFQDILNKNPRWRTSPEGPLLTMYEMENELRKRGYDIDGIIKEKIETEKRRVVSASATSLPPSRATSLTGKIVLTREQKEFCDQNGISYEEYARTLKKSGDKGGIEI